MTASDAILLLDSERYHLDRLGSQIARLAPQPVGAAWTKQLDETGHELWLLRNWLASLSEKGGLSDSPPFERGEQPGQKGSLS